MVTRVNESDFLRSVAERGIGYRSRLPTATVTPTATPAELRIALGLIERLTQLALNPDLFGNVLSHDQHQGFIAEPEQLGKDPRWP